MTKKYKVRFLVVFIIIITTAIISIIYSNSNNNKKNTFLNKIAQINKNQFIDGDVYLTKNDVPYNTFDINDNRFEMSMLLLNKIGRTKVQKTIDVNIADYYKISVVIEQNSNVENIDLIYYHNYSVIYCPQIECYFKISPETETLIKSII